MEIGDFTFALINITKNVYPTLLEFGMTANKIQVLYIDLCLFK